jgi:hypothetical protein
MSKYPMSFFVPGVLPEEYTPAKELLAIWNRKRSSWQRMTIKQFHSIAMQMVRDGLMEVRLKEQRNLVEINGEMVRVVRYYFRKVRRNDRVVQETPTGDPRQTGGECQDDSAGPKLAGQG